MRFLRPSIVIPSIFILALGPSLVFYACKDLAVDPWGGEISMLARYTSGTPSSVIVPKAGLLQAGVDSIKVSRARFVLNRIQLSNDGDSSEFKSIPFILEPSLTGSLQQMLVSGIKYGTYSRVKFKVHRVDPSDRDSLPADQQATFADFLAGDQFSVIIEGTAYL